MRSDSALVAIADQWNAFLRDMSDGERLQCAAALLDGVVRNIMRSRETGYSRHPMAMGHLAIAGDALAATKKVLPAPTADQSAKLHATASLIPQAAAAMARAGVNRRYC